MKTKINGAVLYTGPSALDGTPIVVIVTGLAKGSANTKTGAMLQTWIIRQDMAPHEAQKTGADSAVCGQCPLRPANVKAARAIDPTNKTKACYVRTFQGPRAVHDGWKRGIYPGIVALGGFEALRGRKVRFGSYGDPAAAPAELWDTIAELADNNTGYTHQWRLEGADPARVMASVHTEAERQEAKALGFRTFKVRKAADPLGPGEIACPASKEAGVRTTCEKCRLCGGAAVKGKDIAIIEH
jgi:hypothetical protein